MGNTIKITVPVLVYIYSENPEMYTFKDFKFFKNPQKRIELCTYFNNQIQTSILNNDKKIELSMTDDKIECNLNHLKMSGELHFEFSREISFYNTDNEKATLQKLSPYFKFIFENTNRAIVQIINEVLYYKYRSSFSWAKDTTLKVTNLNPIEMKINDKSIDYLSYIHKDNEFFEYEIDEENRDTDEEEDPFSETKESPRRAIFKKTQTTENKELNPFDDIQTDQLNSEFFDEIDKLGFCTPETKTKSNGVDELTNDDDIVTLFNNESDLREKKQGFCFDRKEFQNLNINDQYNSENYGNDNIKFETDHKNTIDSREKLSRQRIFVLPVKNILIDDISAIFLLSPEFSQYNKFYIHKRRHVAVKSLTENGLQTSKEIVNTILPLELKNKFNLQTGLFM